MWKERLQRTSVYSVNEVENIELNELQFESQS